MLRRRRMSCFFALDTMFQSDARRANQRMRCASACVSLTHLCRQTSIHGPSFPQPTTTTSCCHHTTTTTSKRRVNGSAPAAVSAALARVPRRPLLIAPPAPTSWDSAGCPASHYARRRPGAAAGADATQRNAMLHWKSAWSTGHREACAGSNVGPHRAIAVAVKRHRTHTWTMLHSRQALTCCCVVGGSEAWSVI